MSKRLYPLLSTLIPTITLLGMLLYAAQLFGANASNVTTQSDFVPDVTDISMQDGFAWGDVDRDGDPDLATTGRTGFGVAVYDTIAQQLQDTPFWQHDVFARAVLWGDMNRDGWLDLVVVDTSNRLLIFTNQQGELPDTPSQQLTIQSLYLRDLSLGDVNQDGWLDVALAGVDGAFVYVNNAGTVATIPTWEIDGNFQVLAWGDANADQQLDLAIGGSDALFIFLNQGNALETNASWQTTLHTETKALDWGDVNGDRQLDLAVGNSNNVSLLLHSGGELNPVPSWQTSEPSEFVDWGDVDRDGDLDLLRQGGATSRYAVYLNQGGMLDSVSAWTTTDITGLTSARWVDANSDGDLDFMTSGLNYANVLYSNEQLPFHSTPHWSLGNSDVQEFEAVDYDLDGDLDLSVASGNWVELYENDAGSFALFPDVSFMVDDSADIDELIWHDIDLDGDPDLTTLAAVTTKIWRNDDGTFTFQTTVPFQVAASAAWGDLDGDRYPDLVVSGLRGAAIYQNNAGTLDSNPVWEDAVNRISHITAWADIDNDGDLDLTVADDQFYRTYRNDDGQLTLLDNFTVLSNESARAIAWGDMDGDGDLDLAAEPRARVYLNEGDQLSLGWSADLLISRATFAWHDLDGDRDLDLLYGKVAEGNGGAGVFLNEGGMLRETAAEIATDAIVTTADISGNGRLDLALYAESELRILPNRSPIHPWSVDQTLEVALSAEFAPTSQAGSGPVYSGIMPIPFTLSATAGTLRGYYSLNGGGGWLPAVAASGTPTHEVSSGAHTFLWDIPNSGFLGNSEQVVFRIEATPSYLPQLNGVAGDYQQSLASATSNPFRASGTQVRVVTADGAPASKALIYRLPAGQVTNGPILAALDGVPFETDTNGYLRGRGQVVLGDQLIALQPITHTERYVVYHSSAAPTAVGVDANKIIQLGEQVLTVSAENPLMLFNFDVSLEWDATQDLDFLTRLSLDLQRSSEILYDLSNGQAALGNVNVYQNKVRWYESDIVVLADNTHRPNANLGGIVSEPIIDTLKSGEVISFAALPGQIRMGATWNRYGNPDGTLGEDWPRVLAHEIGHYAFFLLDNYLGIDDQTGLLSNIDCQGSSMTDAYRQDYSEFVSRATLSSTGYSWSGNCTDTLAEATTGRSDWETIQAFYPFLHNNLAQTADGPNRQPFAFTSVEIHTPNSSVAPLTSPIFYMEDSAGNALALADGAAHAYLIQTNDAATSEDDVIVRLGSPRGQVINARGMRAGDRLCIFNQANMPPRLGCLDQVTPFSSTIRLVAFPAWQPEIVVQPVNSTTLAITVTQASVVGDLHVQLFPSDRPTTTIIAPTVPLTSLGGGVYTAEISTPLTIFNAHVRLFDDGHSAETITRFSQTPGWSGNGMVSWGGNGMVSWGGNGMVSWGGNGMVSWGGNSLGIFNAPIASPDGQVVILNTDDLLGYPAPSVLQVVNVPPNVPSWLTPVGEAMRYQTDRPVAETAVMQFSYLQRNLPTSAESQLAIYHYSAETWTRLATSVDKDRNLAAAIMQGNGLYALMATVELPTFSTGWNHFGYPIETSRVVSEALASIENSYTMVYRFEPSATPQWSLYDATVRAPFDTFVNDLNELEFAKGYWIYATEAVTGYLPLNSRGVNQAQNVTLPPLTAYGFVTPNDQFAPEIGMLVEAKVGDVLCGRNEIVSIDGQLGYKIQIGAETVFGPSNGCGTNAAQVSLLVDGVLVAEGVDWAQLHSIQVNLPDYPSFSAIVLVQQSAEMRPINITLLLMLLLFAVGTLQQWRNKNSFLG